MEPCIAGVWRAGADEPNDARLSLDRELCLDRELLGVTDTSVSRAPTAPRLLPVDSRQVRMIVPEQCATNLVVVPNVNFHSLQSGIPPETSAFRVRPGDLASCAAIAHGTRRSLALMRSMSQLPGQLHDHLVPLPRALRCEPGCDQILDAPLLIVIGAGAVAVQPGVTVRPNSGLGYPGPLSFRLPTPGVSLGATRELEQWRSPWGESRVRIAGFDEPLTPEELPKAAYELLLRLSRHHMYVPAYVEDRVMCVALLFDKGDGTAGAIISGTDLDEWLSRLDGVLNHHALSDRVHVPVAVERPSTGPAGPTTPPPDIMAPSSERRPTALSGVCTAHAGYASVLGHIARMVDTDLSILILGESGTGKEHLARAIHAQSTRARGPFVPINLSCLTESLIESELFGYVKGAFTGTDSSHDGVFASASGGTLLLDEFGDAPLRVQLALLRVLENRTVRPVGAPRERAVDVRIIAATSRNLRNLILEERFREDLYQRVADLPVTIPPLRERANDIPYIARSILKSLGSKASLGEDAVTFLRSQLWRGNVRELKSALRRAVRLSEGTPVILQQHFRTLEAVLPDAPNGAAVTFPSVVREVGEQLWDKHELPELSASQYERRAMHRAALLYLAVQKGRAQFPPSLTIQWDQVFGERWHKSENARGLRDLLRRLGLSARDEHARSWILGFIQGGR